MLVTKQLFTIFKVRCSRLFQAVPVLTFFHSFLLHLHFKTHLHVRLKQSKFAVRCILKFKLGLWFFLLLLHFYYKLQSFGGVCFFIQNHFLNVSRIAVSHLLTQAALIVQGYLYLSLWHVRSLMELKPNMK